MLRGLFGLQALRTFLRRLLLRAGPRGLLGFRLWTRAALRCRSSLLGARRAAPAAGGARARRTPAAPAGALCNTHVRRAWVQLQSAGLLGANPGVWLAVPCKLQPYVPTRAHEGGAQAAVQLRQPSPASPNPECPQRGSRRQRPGGRAAPPARRPAAGARWAPWPRRPRPPRRARPRPGAPAAAARPPSAPPRCRPAPARTAAHDLISVRGRVLCRHSA